MNPDNQPENISQVDTGGGAHVGGNVNTGGDSR